MKYKVKNMYHNNNFNKKLMMLIKQNSLLSIQLIRLNKNHLNH